LFFEDVFDGEGDDGFSGFFEEGLDFGDGVGGEVEGDEESFFAVFSDHGGFEGVDIGSADLVFLFDLDGIPGVHEVEFARFFLRSGGEGVDSAIDAHIADLGLGGGVSVFEGSFFFGFAPEDFVVSVGVEGRVDVDEVHGSVGEFLELFEVVATVDDAGIEEGGWFCGGCRGRFLYRLFLFCHRVEV